VQFFVNWKSGLGLPSEDGTVYGVDTELAYILIRLENEWTAQTGHS
jgi:hypothetical protein